MQTFLMIAAGVEIAAIAYLLWLCFRRVDEPTSHEYTRIDFGDGDPGLALRLQEENAAARHALGIDAPVTEIVPLPPKEWRVPVREDLTVSETFK